MRTLNLEMSFVLVAGGGGWEAVWGARKGERGGGDSTTV